MRRMCGSAATICAGGTSNDVSSPSHATWIKHRVGINRSCDTNSRSNATSGAAASSAATAATSLASVTGIPFSVANVPMRPIFHMAAFIGDGVPNFEIRDVEKGTDLLVKTPKLGAALARTLGRHPASLMRGHGAVVVGENIARAVGRSVYLEQSAQLQMQAMLLSSKLTFLDEAEVKASVPVQNYNRAWPMWREKALASARADRNR